MAARRTAARQHGGGWQHGTGDGRARVRSPRPSVTSSPTSSLSTVAAVVVDHLRAGELGSRRRRCCPRRGRRRAAPPPPRSGEEGRSSLLPMEEASSLELRRCWPQALSLVLPTPISSLHMTILGSSCAPSATSPRSVLVGGGGLARDRPRR
uniref:Uncharacterized protein n=1 Tax=Oryza nivara TaxID=4536 RepID=A0A0E0HXR0_ORYNI